MPVETSDRRSNTPWKRILVAPHYWVGELIWSGEYETSRKAYYRSYVSRKKPVGFKMPTAYSRDMLEGDFYFTNVYARFYDPYYDMWSTHLGSATSPSTDLSTALSFDNDVASKAELRALLNLKNEKVSLSQAFAERQQTANLVASTARRLASAIRDIRRGRLPTSLGKLRKGHNLRQSAAQLWLELQYAWKPLLKDVHGSAEALADADYSDPARYGATVRGHASNRTVFKDDRDGLYVESHTPCHYFCRADYTNDAMVHLNYSMDNPYVVQAASLGLTDPLELAWELLPFSFVADWFYPIGTYISALNADAGWTFLAGSLSRRVEGRYVQRLSNNHNPANNGTLQFVNVYGYAKARRKTIYRTTYSNTPVPDLVKPKNPLSLLHMSEAIALLQQAFR